ncbi:hypothetical protein SAMN04515674_104219 [Pseudarcicella hirudinis]|uniref:Fibronectin type-III domain-containing protein n=1 Tax=Pseudarcicella hirudinis TaxID=1079859 RepID=A0A1I5RSB2_9BACT|nr:hypothetical protein [Pseudarcicella hirudinis]SFP61398.1 hypothetical protein SAMN04515674_104219 [Pseudarcicella hirudinis]
MKHLTAFLFFSVSLWLCWACKSTAEEVGPNTNQPPAAFVIKASLSKDSTVINLAWTKAIDPDGDKVSYTVVSKDTLIKNLTDTTYNIRNVSFSIYYSGKVIATDAKGLSTEASFTIFKNAVSKIKDANFEQILVDKKIDSDGLVNGQIMSADALLITALDLSGYNKTDGKKIKNLSGIEAFLNLKTLDCSFNKMDSIDISGNPFLISLECYSNNLKTLNISNNPGLTFLDCGANLLTNLDVSKDTLLTSIRCDTNRLVSLTLGKNGRLTNLWCPSNSLTSLDLSGNPALSKLDCSFNILPVLDLTKNTKLTFLSCSSNKLTRLDLSKNINLTSLWYTDSGLTTLDISNNTALTDLRCNGNQLTALDISKNTALLTLNCYNNNLTSLSVSLNTVLVNLDCRSNPALQTICVKDTAAANLKTTWFKDSKASYAICP